MALDLHTLIPSLKREVNPPGQSNVTALDDEWLGRLMDAFWNGRIDGLFAGYVVDDTTGEVTPITTGAADMPRELGQAIVFLAAYNAIYLVLLNQRSQFRAQSGENVYEYQQSAQVMRELSQSLKERRDILLYRLSDIGVVSDYVIDGFLEKQNRIELGLGYVVAAGHGWPINIGGTATGGW